jgi:CheY-specific phosphatase CheX
MSSNLESIPREIEKGIVETLSIQLSMKAAVVRTAMVREQLHTKNFDCMSSVSLNSSKYLGTLSICFPENTLLLMNERLTGEKFSSLSAECSDASGEILNIIYASARKRVNESGFDFLPALPTTVIGKGLNPAGINPTDIVLYFECESETGPFLVILSLRIKA